MMIVENIKFNILYLNVNKTQQGFMNNLDFFFLYDHEPM